MERVLTCNFKFQDAKRKRDNEPNVDEEEDAAEVEMEDDLTPTGPSGTPSPASKRRATPSPASRSSASPSPGSKRKAEIDRLRSKQGKAVRHASRMEDNETGYYEEKGAFAETHKKKHLTGDELAVDVKLCNNPIDMNDIASTNQKILIQLSKLITEFNYDYQNFNEFLKFPFRRRQKDPC